MGVGVGITLNDVDCTHHFLSGSLSYTWRINERGSGSFVWMSNIPLGLGAGRDIPDLLPEIGDQIAVFNGDGVRLFTGDVGEIKTKQVASRWIGGNQVKGGIFSNITLQALECRLERRAVIKQEEEELTPAAVWLPDEEEETITAGGVVTDILTGEDFRLIAETEGITIGTIEDGAVLEKFIVGQDGASNVWAVIQQLAKMSENFYAHIDAEGAFHFRERTATQAPFSLVHPLVNVEPDIEVYKHWHDKRNVQHHRIAWEAFDPLIWVFEGDGELTEFPLQRVVPDEEGNPVLVDAYPIRIDSIVLLSNGEEIPLKFGVRDVDTGPSIEWFWSPGEPIISQHEDAEVVPTGDKIRVTFRRLGGDTVTETIDEEIDQLFEKVSEDLECKVEADGQTAAAQVIAEHSEPKTEVTFSTNLHLEPTIADLEPGMFIPTLLPYFGVKAPEEAEEAEDLPLDMLVDEISISDKRGTIIDYKVHMISGTVNPKYTDYMKEGIGKARKTQDLNKGDQGWFPEEKSIAFGSCAPATGTDVSFRANVLTSGTPYHASFNSKEGSTGTVDVLFSTDASTWVSLTGGQGFAISDDLPHNFTAEFDGTPVTTPGILRADVISGSIEWGVVTVRWKRLPPEAGDTDGDDPGNPIIPAVI